MNQSQRMQINPTETIIGFNFNFMQTLLAKAQELRAAKRLYNISEGASQALCTPTALGAGIMNHLSLQMGLSGDFTANNLTNVESVYAIISAAEEFLAIFKK